MPIQEAAEGGVPTGLAGGPDVKRRRGVDRPMPIQEAAEGGVPTGLAGGPDV